eukprot:4960557-Pyramimonas_sp.AAC.1
MNDLGFATKSPDHWPLIVSVAAAKLHVSPGPGRPKLDRHKLAATQSSRRSSSVCCRTYRCHMGYRHQLPSGRLQ